MNEDLMNYYEEEKAKKNLQKKMTLIAEKLGVLNPDGTIFSDKALLIMKGLDAGVIKVKNKIVYVNGKQVI